MEKQEIKQDNDFTQLCVWPATIVETNIKDFEEFMLNPEVGFGVRVKYEGEIKTNPDLDENGQSVPETGGRNDLFFYIHKDDIFKFTVPRLEMGIRWWEDVINDNGNLYPKEFIKNI